MSINRVLTQGKAGLAATQTGLATVSHNVSNVNTEGYSRQRVDFQANEPVTIGNMRVGTGVVVGAITRSASEFVNRRLEEESTNLGKYEGMSEVMTQLETTFKDDGQEGLSHTMSRFFNDIRTLSTQPESQPLRSAVRESASALTTRFQSLLSGVDQVRADLDRRVDGSVADINQLTKRIGDLNRRIMEVENGGNGSIMANDERDSRDIALQKLSKIVNIQVTPIENGGITVSSNRLGVLVAGIEPNEFRTVHAQAADGGTSIRIHLVGLNDHTGKDVTDFADSGALGGFLKVRDETIPALTDKLNGIAYRLSGEVNDIHRQAFGLNGKVGNDFFAPLTGAKGAAAEFRISDAVAADPGNIGGALKANASGDNRALLAIADLQDKKMFDKGHGNITDQAASIIGDVGVQVKSLNENFDTQRGLIEQLSGVREKLSGVSLDEEAVNMIQFQKAFDANAKLIQVADNLMDTVLNLKRF